MSISKSKVIIKKAGNGYIVTSGTGVLVVEGNDKSLEDFISKGIVAVACDKLNQIDTIKVEIEVSDTFQPGEI